MSSKLPMLFLHNLYDGEEFITINDISSCMANYKTTQCHPMHMTYFLDLLTWPTYLNRNLNADKSIYIYKCTYTNTVKMVTPNIHLIKNLAPLYAIKSITFRWIISDICTRTFNEAITWTWKQVYIQYCWFLPETLHRGQGWALTSSTCVLLIVLFMFLLATRFF